MSHEDIDFYGSSYVDALAIITRQQLFFSKPNYFFQDLTLITGDANAFLATYNETSNPLPSDADTFFIQAYNYGVTHGGFAGSVNQGVALDDMRTQFMVTYARGLSGSHQSDWNTLTPTIYVATSESDYQNAASPLYSPTNPLRGQSLNWFSHFLSDYNYEGDGSVGNMQDKMEFLIGSQTATLITSNFLTSSYLNYYNTAFGNTTGFPALLQSFYTQKLSEDGYFSPSLSVFDWQLYITQSLKANDPHPFIVDNPATPTLASMNSYKTKVLDSIYNLIASLLSSLQSVALAQANRLTILTQWQKAYTDSIAQIHVFLAGDGTRLGGALANSGTVRADLNDHVNTNFREIMQNNRSVVGDDAKALQSNINQSNDAVQQQASMATSIIQELSTILSAIFR